MKSWLHTVELFVDAIIPFVLAVLIFVIAIEIYFVQIKNKYSFWFDAFDIFVITIFLLDLFFKYERVRNMKNFIKEYWADIIAVFPFFIIFRFLEIFRLAELIEGPQKVLHESIEIERESQRLVREAEEVAKISRTEKFLRYFRVFGRFPRFLRALPFFEQPTGGHHFWEKKPSLNKNL